jgi:uncharacterized protein (TIGR02246 family)
VGETRVAALLADFARAAVTGDHVALDALLDDDFEFVSAHARVMGREQRLAALSHSAAILARLEFGEIAVREWADSAVVRAGFAAEFRPDAGTVRTDRGVSTFVLVRRGTAWRICHQHNSHIGGV